MLYIQDIVKSTLLVGSLFALAGCGDEGCCFGPEDSLGVVEAEKSTPVQSVELGNKGTPKVLPLANNSLLEPTAIITIDDKDMDDAPMKLEVGKPHHFSGKNSHDPDGSIRRYLWDTGDGQSIDAAFDKQYPHKGLYKIKLKVTDDDNLTDTTDTCVLVGLQSMPLVVDIGDDKHAKEGEEVTFSADVLCQDGSGFDYRWTDEDGDELSREPHFTTKELEKGHHKIKLLIKDGKGHCTHKYIHVDID